ncbi:hypothetical protein NRB20_25730 [Nocardia sp. RB20]|uniref:Transglycosylase SLT domain-containing protein n=2 Tax=Nocardia macrotermitis TaxID=2585198 RepID=A0A7K0D184_9NOCA|nr:hypothetical protein [Nocardia macrotermitis]
MGGADPATAWNSAYQRLADDVIDTVRAYWSALRRLSDILNICGWNWDTAEHNALIGKNKSAAPAKPTLNTASELNLPHVPEPGNGSGLGLFIDPLMATPLFMVGTSLGGLRIPGGDIHRLEAAATAWNAFAISDPFETSPALRQISDSFGAINAPEVMDIQEILITLENGQAAIWNAAGGLAKGVRAYHDELVNFRAALAAEAPDAFLHETVTVTTTATEVRITLTGKITDNIDTAATALENVFTRHPLSGLLRTPVFGGAESGDIIGRMRSIAEIPLVPESGNQQDNTRLDGAMATIETWEAAPTTLSAVDVSKIDPTLRPWTEAAVTYGNQAGIDPRLVLAIVANEGATRTLQGGSGLSDEYDIGRYLTDPARVAGGYLGIGGNKEGNSLGLTNMKENTFNDVKAAFPDQFKNDDWHDLIGNNDLAIKATTYKLKLIENQFGPQVHDDIKSKYTLNQFLAASYNAGDKETSRYVQTGSIGPAATSYMERATQHFNHAQDLLCSSGAYICN